MSVPTFPVPKTDAKPDMFVIGIGLPRTGTLSLCKAFEILGFGPCYHMVEFQHMDHVELWRKIHRGEDPTDNLYQILADYRSECDFPVSRYPEQLFAAFPNAKVVLNTILRAYRWSSLSRHIGPTAGMLSNWADEMLWGPEGIFKNDFKKNATSKFEKHIENCKRSFPPEQ